ncbi:hypothetical protein [Acidiphilium acidophilum]|uniref:Uncharacterized protein n=1 Tax=Acidiphilium acidophilum TaxID=76588 RepID=A0AAW9DWP6_ACIAO|nr:hypothetical protein [Acidiphilium acidophilum]MDX5932944.1 hypothetical protein [Acidiphilium acidophilum]GBQ21044.1 hypothetical protein AA700_1391 [Acidiphilium acidophilum DSM 700]
MPADPRYPTVTAHPANQCLPITGPFGKGCEARASPRRRIGRSARQQTGDHRNDCKDRV